jgi:hypothetical protein
VIGAPFFRSVMALAWIAAMLLASGAWLEGWPHFARRILAWRTASD